MAKAKKTPTYVAFLLDRSGSMGSIREATIEAFNAYLDGLKTSGEDYIFSFLQFDSMSIDTLVKNAAITDVPELTAETFVPRGSTPLIDACFKTIKGVEEALSRRDDKPKVVICFQTDGQENCSRQHTMAALNGLIKEKSALGWQFNFMGASIDAYQQATAMGLGAVNTMSYDSSNLAATRSAFGASAAATARFSSGMTMTSGYTPEEKRASGDVFDPDLTQPEANKPEGAKAWTPPVDPLATSAGNKTAPIVDDVKL